MMYPGFLEENVMAFARILRSEGMRAGPREAGDALTALRRLELTDRGDFFHTLRTLFPGSPREIEHFDHLFEGYFGGGLLDGSRRTNRGTEEREQLRASIPRFGLSLVAWSQGSETGGETRQGSYSPLEVLTGSAPPGIPESARLKLTVRRLARKLSRHRSRRRRVSSRGRVPDLRRTVHRSTQRGGELMDLVFRRRRMDRVRLVVLMDVSGSMELHSSFLFQFSHACASQRGLGRVEVFAFSTRLYRLTRALQVRGARGARQALMRVLPRKSTGTRIGACFQDYLDRYPHQLGSQTAVLVLSDGWDTGDLEMLERTLLRLKQSGSRLLWLSPLAAAPGYRPTTAGIKVILPHTDAFAPVVDLASLRRFTDRL